MLVLGLNDLDTNLSAEQIVFRREKKLHSASADVETIRYLLQVQTWVVGANKILDTDGYKTNSQICVTPEVSDVS